MAVVGSSEPARRGAQSLDERGLARTAHRLRNAPPEEIIAWATTDLGMRVGFATGFGIEGCMLVDVIARHRLSVEVFTLDTGILFPETYDLWKRLEARYGITIRAERATATLDEQAREHGEALWLRNPDRCCALRKVEVLDRALGGYEAWVAAIRRDQTPARASANVVELDGPSGLVKLNPLAFWQRDDVKAYVRVHDVPTNILYEQGYASIGCIPCTSPVAHGEDERAGRWRGLAKTECGIHTRRSAPPGRAPVVPLGRNRRREQS